VTRTFSKAHGLGGLRVGYGVADPAVVEALLVVREAFCTSLVAQVAATAALADVDHVRRSRELNATERGRVSAALAERGYTVLPSLGNFLTFDTGDDGRDVFRRLLARGVIVRPLDPYGMRRWLRVSIGTPEENAAFLAALEAVCEQPRP
jgi:histidinol-phosphate aminotransferase